MSLNGTGLAYRGWKAVAMSWLVVGRADKAAAVFDRMLAQWPHDGYALSSRAHLNAQRGRRDLAVADLQRLVAAQPEARAAYWFNLAYLLEELGRYAEAEPAFRRALAIDPKLDRAWYGMALVLIRLRRPDEAVDALKKNTELQPMSPYGWYQLARVQFDRHEPDEALKIIRHLKGFEPKVAAQLERETGLVASTASS
jgi:tetratricopeptide (TPR) repeat protein